MSEWAVEAWCPHGVPFRIPLHLIQKQGLPKKDPCPEGERDRLNAEIASNVAKWNTPKARRAARRAARKLRPEDFSGPRSV